MDKLAEIDAKLDELIAAKTGVVDQFVEKYRRDAAQEGEKATFVSMTLAFLVTIQHGTAIELLAVAIKKLADQTPATEAVSEPTPTSDEPALVG